MHVNVWVQDAAHGTSRLGLEAAQVVHSAIAEILFQRSIALVVTLRVKVKSAKTSDPCSLARPSLTAVLWADCLASIVLLLATALISLAALCSGFVLMAPLLSDKQACVHLFEVMCAARYGGRFSSTSEILTSLKNYERRNRRMPGRSQNFLIIGGTLMVVLLSGSPLPSLLSHSVFRAGETPSQNNSGDDFTCQGVLDSHPLPLFPSPLPILCQHTRTYCTSTYWITVLPLLLQASQKRRKGILSLVSRVLRLLRLVFE